MLYEYIVIGSLVFANILEEVHFMICLLSNRGSLMSKNN